MVIKQLLRRRAHTTVASEIFQSQLMATQQIGGINRATTATESRPFFEIIHVFLDRPVV